MTLRVPMMLRDRTAEDVPFVVDAWVRGARWCPAFRGVPRAVYEHHERAFIQRMWRDQGATWLMAAPPDSGTFAYGFLCGEATDAGPVLHFLYTKSDDRRFGVAGEMLESFLEGQPRNRGFYTHRTSAWEHLLDGSKRFRHEDWLYNPFLAGVTPAWRT